MDPEILQVVGIFGALALVAMIVLTLALSYFIVPQAPPTRRAGWISGLAYFLIVVGAVFALATAEDVPPLAIPPEVVAVIAPLPAVLLVFLYWRWSFRRAWLDDDAIPEGVEVNEDDWRSGLFRLGMLILLALSSALVEYVLENGIRMVL